MKVIETDFEGLLIIEPRLWEDERGYFFESYSQQKFAAAGIDITFVQDNEAKSSRGVLRGLHYQLPPYAQSKLVRVVSGSVLDVVVDIRPQSKTYGRSFSIELSAENKRQLLVPQGFAHGYVVLEEDTIFCYKCDNFYHKESEGGILWSDTQLAIDWQLSEAEIIVSEKDSILPVFGKHQPFR